MKKLFTLLTALIALSISSFAQNSVQLNIHHKLASEDFAMNIGAKNNLDNDFKVTRLEYYISEISIVHDGGTETTIEDLWVLVDASEVTSIDLGNHDITNVESLNFYIGVDPDHNHLDPSSWPNDHPLAPQFPSMQWGWAAGYRFLAMEGFGGSSFNQLFQFHGLGDNNYFQNQIPITATPENNVITLNIDGDYTAILENIAVDGGNIVHGDYGDAKKTLENTRDLVFTASPIGTATVDFSEINGFDVFPNPTMNGVVTVSVSATADLNYGLSVTDILGRQVLYFDEVNSNSTIDLQLKDSGFYFVNLIKDGQTVIIKKLIAK